MELTARRPGVALAPPPALPGAALAALGVVALAAEQGGYATSAWRAGTVAFAAVAGLFALWRPTRFTWPMAMPPALVAALGLWSLLSATWSVAPSASTLDAQRTLLYLAAAVAFAVAGDGLTLGVLGGATIVAVWALGDRVVHGAPVDAYEGRLLTGPIGYANGLGALVAIGIAISVALVVRRRYLAAIPLVVLVPALLLTNSRAAEAACAVGIVVATGRRRLAAAAVVAAAAALTALLLFTPSSLGDRASYWSAARHIGAAHPLAGTGAGTFHVDYTRLPPGHDAHSLYLQAFAELGVVGLVLVVALVALPLALAIRRGQAAIAAGLAVFALHAGVDWDWQLPVVAVAGLALIAAATKPTPLELR